ncbi:MAG: acyl-CoA dehydrogenase family protein, partial [Ginsengibacter sp.]
MDFLQSDLTTQVGETARDFAAQYIKPNVMTWDESQEFPVNVFKEMGKLGFMGILVPEKYNGSGLSYFEYVIILQEISKVCGSIGLSVAAHNSLCSGHILLFGNEEQKEKYLTKLATAEYIGAWGLTEPNTGSDAGNMKCTAVKNGDEWIIDGTKNWITHGISGDVAVVICRTGEPRTKDNSTAFIVERNTPGFKGGKKE